MSTSTHGHDFSRWNDQRHILHDPIYKPWEAYLIEHNNWMFTELAGMLGDTILEVGAHSGLGCLTIKSRYRKFVVASDINLECCKAMVQRFKYWCLDIPVVCCDAFNLPFKDKSVTVCFSVGLLEHYEKEDAVKLIREQLRITRYAIVDVPTERCGYGYGDERFRTQDEWVEIANSVGKVVHIFSRQEGICGLVIDSEDRL